MKIKAVRSDIVYNKILNAKQEKKEDIYRYDLMKEFQDKWDCYHVPIKAKYEGGYDVVMASSMLGYLEPKKVDGSVIEDVTKISNESIWESCTESIKKAIAPFEKAKVPLAVEEYKYTILLLDPESIYTQLSKGCCGDGGIPGSIFISLLPSEENIQRIPAVLAHECNHNVRFQFIKWSNSITLEEMMINEGLAENYATWMYGEEAVGPWVTAVDQETILGPCKPILKEGRNVQGLEGITAYLYGDEIAKQRGYFPVGLPFCAGYAFGFFLIKSFLEKTKLSIVEATLLPYEEIKKESKEFWD